MKIIILSICSLITYISFSMEKNSIPLNKVTAENLAQCTTKDVWTYDFLLRKKPIPNFVKKLKIIKSENPYLFMQYVHHMAYLQNKDKPGYLKYKNDYAWNSFIVLLKNSITEWKAKQNDYLMIILFTISTIKFFSSYFI